MIALRKPYSVVLHHRDSTGREQATAHHEVYATRPRRAERRFLAQAKAAVACEVWLGQHLVCAWRRKLGGAA